MLTTEMDRTDTRELLLDSAEKLFGELGLEASLRAITQDASANIASVNYHFGSKEGLIREVLSRRLKPLNQRRLEMLAEAESRSRGGVPKLEEIIYAFMQPTLAMTRDLPDRGRNFMRLMGRMHVDADAEVMKLLMGEFAEVVERFSGAMMAALPEVDPKEVFWGFHFGLGAMLHLLSCSHHLERYTDGLCSIDDLDGTVDRLVDFVVGGLKAQVRSQSRNGKRGKSAHA